MGLHVSSNFDQNISHSLLTPIPIAATNPLFSFRNQVMLTASNFSFIFLLFNSILCVLLLSSLLSFLLAALNLNECLCFCSRFRFSWIWIFIYTIQCINHSTPKFFKIGSVWFTNKSFFRVFCTVETSVGKLMASASIQYSTICVLFGKICQANECWRRKWIVGTTCHEQRIKPVTTTIQC